MTVLRGADGGLLVKDAEGALTAANELKLPGIKPRVFVTDHILLPGDSCCGRGLHGLRPKAV